MEQIEFQFVQGLLTVAPAEDTRLTAELTGLNILFDELIRGDELSNRSVLADQLPLFLNEFKGILIIGGALGQSDWHASDFLRREGNFSNQVKIGRKVSILPAPTFTDEELAELQPIHDAAIEYYATKHIAHIAMPERDDEDVTAAQHLMSQLEPHDKGVFQEMIDNSKLANNERERFQKYMVDVDPACRVTWLPAGLGLYLLISGHDPANTLPIRETIAGDSALLGKSGIDSWHVRSVGDVIQIFVPYEGLRESESS